MRRQTRKVMFRVSSIPRLRCGNSIVVKDELYHVELPPLVVLGKLKVVKVYIPDQLPAMSDLISTGFPASWSSECWSGLSAHRPPDVPASSDVRCSFGVQVSPHLLSSCWHIGGFNLSKDSGCVFRHMALHFRLF